MANQPMAKKWQPSVSVAVAVGAAEAKSMAPMANVWRYHGWLPAIKLAPAGLCDNDVMWLIASNLNIRMANNDK